MDSSISVLLGSFVGGLCAILGGILVSRTNARAQERMADRRVEADLRLQADRLRDAAASADLALRRTKLQDLHVFLSEVAAQCSQTQAQLDYQMGRDLEKHTARWTELRAGLNQANAIADVYFPDISHHMTEVARSINVFNWTSREFLQQDHDLKGEHGGWDLWYTKIIKSSDQTAAVVYELKQAIAKEAQRLAEMTPLFNTEKERWIRGRESGLPSYKYIIKRDVVVLTEFNPQFNTITNAAEDVIRDLAERGVLDPTKPRRIVYLDQQGRWDGLAVRDGNFASFVMLGARSEEDAIQAAIQSDWNASAE
jgi:hypothetical protein